MELCDYINLPGRKTKPEDIALGNMVLTALLYDLEKL
ncbi:MAG: hypothetical protein ACI8Y7_000783 [Candidatus Woesearchaeota archaeon]|jgi:hypothetical protein